MHKRTLSKSKILFIIPFFVLSSNINLYSYDSTKTKSTTIWQDFGNDIITGLNEAGAYVTIPLHTSAEQWLFTAAFLDALVVTSTTDLALKEKINSKTSNDYNHNFWDIPTYYGEPITAGIISGGVYLTGLFSRNTSVRVTGRMLIESVAFAGVIDLLLKSATGRYRPYYRNDQYWFKAFQTKDEHVSFPSGHTTLAFAVSTVLAERIDNNYARIGFYGLATLTGCARIANNKHWLTDVMAGSLLGFGTGWFIVHRNPSPQQGGEKGFSVFPSMNGLNVMFKW